MKLLVKEAQIIEDINIYLHLYEVHNSYLLLISDQEDMGIGNVTLGNPPTIEGIKTPTASYNFFGLNTKLLSTIIVERASFMLKKPVLLLLFLKSKKKEEEIIKPLISFLNNELNKVIKKMQRVGISK